jgi:hypothetical protein
MLTEHLVIEYKFTKTSKRLLKIRKLQIEHNFCMKTAKLSKHFVYELSELHGSSYLESQMMKVLSI